jgi:hypothetical protein
MFIELTHANTKKKADIIKTKIFAVMESDSMKCTMVISTEGGAFPVIETKEYITNLLEEDENVRSNH